MHLPIKLFSAIRPLIVSLALAVAAVAGASESEGYFMMAKVTKVRADGQIDFWVTSVHGLPREESPETGTEAPQLPKVIATLELKSTGASPRVQSSGLLGFMISLRGKCEDLDRATRVPVIQVRLGNSQPWQQASLEPRNRAGNTGFKQLAAGVCRSDTASQSAPTAALDDAA